MPKSVSKSTPRPARKTSKAAPAALPANATEAASLMRALAVCIADIERKKADSADALQRIQSSLAADIEPLMDKAAEIASQLHGFAESHKIDLAGAGKTAPILNTGTVEWATTPPAVSIADVDAVLKRIRALGKTDFIRTHPDTIDKDAMLKDAATAEAIEGVEISQEERVYVKPAGLRGRMIATIGKRGKPGKWKADWPKDEETQQ